ncbi:MAG: hypothetical protein ACJ74G_04935 [Blastocatellia bacterium]
MLVCCHRFAKLCVTVALILSTTAALATAAHSGDGPRRLVAAKPFVPIGKLFSLGAVMIDGRVLSGEQLLWGGEQVYAKEASAAVQLGGAGQLLLYRGSLARLSLDVPPDRTVVGEAALTVVVAAGEVAVSLEPAAGARIVVGDTTYRASRGAKFKVRTADLERPFELKAGVITKETLPQEARYIVTWLKVDPVTNKPIAQAPDHQKVRAKHTASRAAGAQKKPGTSGLVSVLSLAGYSPQQPDNLVPGLAISFCLESNPTIGRFVRSGQACETATTNQYGAAVVEFQAGSNRGRSTIQARVVSSPSDFKLGTIEVVKPAFWRWRNVLILAAAAGGVICLFKCRPHSTPPLQQVPPNSP